MSSFDRLYINGEWVQSTGNDFIDVINPATEQSVARVAAGTAADVDAAVSAAANAFASYSQTSVAERVELLEAILAQYQNRWDDLAQATMDAMGAPRSLSWSWQTNLGKMHLESALKALKSFEFETVEDGMLLQREAIGVCGMITPWNWPMNQVAVKVAPALAAGCTMVLKPSEESPLDAMVFAEILHEAGVPAGVFNLINGYGPVVGEAMSAHPDISMMSFTGSTRGGIAVAKTSADTVKRVAQELGGKSANILLDDCDIDSYVVGGVDWVMQNSGQSCNAPTRMLVPRDRLAEAEAAAIRAAEATKVDVPDKEGDHLGPVVNAKQFQHIQSLIQTGIDEGAKLITGGTGRPDHLDSGYYVKPTVFSEVNNNMRIAREEVFGPVLTIIPYDTEEEAIAIANDSDYGLAAYVNSGTQERATRVAKHLRAGQVIVNYVGGGADTPFGGYKMSGNGREKGRWGLEEYLELKAITGAV